MSRFAPRSRARRRFNTLAASTLAGLAGPTFADLPFPTRPVRVVVPFPPGGNTDVLARLLSRPIGDDLGQSVVIENKAGAGGNLGVDAVAKSPPDGYTLVYSTLSTHALNQGLYSRLPFDPVRDLSPIALTVQVPLVLVVPARAGVRTLGELIARLKANPGRHFYASAGNGTSSHIACHLFTSMAGVEVGHVPYKGTGPALVDMLGGRVDFMMDAPSVLNAHIRSGVLVPLAVAVSERMKALPDVPTFDEAGLRGYRAYSWNAFWAPAGTPEAVLDRLHAGIARTLADPGMQARIEETGVVAFSPMSRAEVARFMQREHDTWVPLVRAMGVRLD